MNSILPYGRSGIYYRYYLFIYLPAFTSPFMDGHPKSMKLMKFFARIFSGRRTRTPFFAEAVSEGIRETLQEMEYHLKMK
jgi:hypothetical protein